MGMGSPSLLLSWMKIDGSSDDDSEVFVDVVLKCSKSSIRFDTPIVNCSTCSRMYSRKASLLHLPIRMITIVWIPDRNIAIAPPERMEWRPISSLVNPRDSAPMMSTIARSRGRAWAELIQVIDPSDSWTEHFFDSNVAPGIASTRAMDLAADLTGQSSLSLVQNM